MDVWLVVFFFIFGAAIGSFLNAIVCRLSSRESFVMGRSHCPHCRASLRWYDLLPIASWLALGGRCRYCRRKISARYLGVEVITAAIFALGAATVSDSRQLLVYLVSVSFFVILFIYDMETYVIPDSISLPALGVIFLLNLLSGASWLSLAAGMLAGGLWFLAQFLLSRGRWVGGGDIRLGLLVGALLGWPKVALGLMIAYIGGSIIALGLLLAGRARFGSRLPFATMLLPAGLLTWLWGGQIWQTYISWLGF